MNKAAIVAGLAQPQQPMSVSHETICCEIYAMLHDMLFTSLVSLHSPSVGARILGLVIVRAISSQQP